MSNNVQITVDSQPVSVIANGSVTVTVGSLQGPPGPIGPNGNNVPTVHAVNKDSVTIRSGQAIAIHSSGVGFVRATAVGLSYLAIGLATSDIPATQAGDAQPTGYWYQADWTLAAGTATLSRGHYYLSQTAGMLTQSPTSATGNVLQCIGYCVSPNTLLVQIDGGIQL